MGLRALLRWAPRMSMGDLFVALGAGLVSRIEPAPGERAVFALVVPGCCGLGGGKGGRGEYERGKYRKTHKELLFRETE